MEKARVAAEGRLETRVGLHTDEKVDLRKKPRPGEMIINGLLFIAGALSIFTTVGILFVLGSQSWLFFGSEEVSIAEFFTSTVWQPALGDFGIWALISATLTTSLVAMCVAIPLGLAAAIYLSEYASPKVRGTFKPVLEVLAGVPTVVYGFFALTFVTPILRGIFGPGTIPSVYNMLAPGLVMGIMILPIIASMSEDALHAVPRALREGAYGLGSTRLETAIRIVVPAALSGIIAAVIVGISRAIGETMIVAIAAGASPNFSFNPFQAAETMTGHIARISGGDLSYGTIDYNSIFAIGLTLFFMTLGLNILAQWATRRFREVYE
jgi:phosphate transport system permease protein